MRKTVPCPKCGRKLRQSGELTVSGLPGMGGNEVVVVPTFECDECLMTVDIGEGETMEVGLVFAVDKHGKAFDPADPEGKLRI